MSQRDIARWVPPAGGWRARITATVLVACVLLCLAGATSSGPWWYTWRAWGLALVALAAGAAVAWAARQPWAPVRGPSASPSARVGVPRPPAAPAADARPLIEALVELLEQSPTPAQQYRMERALATAGLVPFRADGEVFDPSRHLAVDVAPTDDPARVRRVAQTLRPGYARGAAVVQVAHVLVYDGATPGVRPRG